MNPRAICETCGVEFEYWRSRGKVKFCSMKCYKRDGSRNPKWRGGRFMCDGYIYVYSPEHPHKTKAGYVVEHRLAMEKKIGRILNNGEVVHHINGIRTDNRISNLVLCSSYGRHVYDEHVVGHDKKGRFKYK